LASLPQVKAQWERRIASLSALGASCAKRRHRLLDPTISRVTFPSPMRPLQQPLQHAHARLMNAVLDSFIIDYPCNLVERQLKIEFGRENPTIEAPTNSHPSGGGFEGMSDFGDAVSRIPIATSLACRFS
jgi:hypothetical protein